MCPDSSARPMLRRVPAKSLPSAGGDITWRLSECRNDNSAPRRAAPLLFGGRALRGPPGKVAAGREMRLPRRAHDAMLERIAAYWQSQLVFVAAKLGIADVLVAGPLTADEIATRLGAHAPHLRRVL